MNGVEVVLVSLGVVEPPPEMKKRWQRQEIIEQDQHKPWYNRRYWTTKDGRVLFPQEFEDSHLVNTIKFLESSANLYLDRGEHAYFTPEEWLGQTEIYPLLIKEALKRKLLSEDDYVIDGDLVYCIRTEPVIQKGLKNLLK